jgi:hypothetical protein
MDAGVPVDCACPTEWNEFDTPMEAALACACPSAKDVVRLLLARGAAPVDVSTIRAASKFQSGVYPCTPDYFKSRMPDSFRFEGHD